MPEPRYVPVAGHAWLTPLYDSAVALATREQLWRTRLADEVHSQAAHTILDVGCGTGTLAIQLAKRLPAAYVIGLDGDPAILARAAAKTDRAGVEVEYIEALADAIPLRDGTVHCALSSLVFHHLDVATKRRALTEIRRVLAPGGQLLLCDYGRPHDPLMRSAFLFIQLLDGFPNTRPHANGKLPPLIRECGFTVHLIERLRTMTGTLELWRVKP